MKKNLVLYITRYVSRKRTSTFQFILIWKAEEVSINLAELKTSFTKVAAKSWGKISIFFFFRLPVIG